MNASFYFIKHTVNSFSVYSRINALHVLSIGLWQMVNYTDNCQWETEFIWGPFPKLSPRELLFIRNKCTNFVVHYIVYYCFRFMKSHKTKDECNAFADGRWKRWYAPWIKHYKWYTEFVNRNYYSLRTSWLLRIICRVLYMFFTIHDNVLWLFIPRSTNSHILSSLNLLCLVSQRRFSHFNHWYCVLNQIL